jgi:hypothetical protein
MLNWFLNLNWELFVKFLGTILSWPVIVLILGLSFLVYYKQALTELLQRLQCGTLPGGARIELAPYQNNQVNSETIKNGPVFVGEEAPKTREGWIAWIKKNPERAYEMGTNLELMIAHEKVMNMIYGTQLRLLDCLAGNSNGIDYNLTRGFYFQHLHVAPGSKYPESDYYGFLLRTELIAMDNNKVFITPRGISFLDYIKPIYPNYLSKSF